MLANVLLAGSVSQSVQPVMKSVFLAGVQLGYIGKSDVIAMAVIGALVISAAVFALMCRYR